MMEEETEKKQVAVADQVFSPVSEVRKRRSFSWRKLSRYSLLIVLAIAAVSITVLHLKGRSLLQAIRATPLPVFRWEKALEKEPLPDKTEVYQQTLKEEAKEKRQRISQQNSAVFRPDWQYPQKRPVAEVQKMMADTTTDDKADSLASHEKEALPLPSQQADQQQAPGKAAAKKKTTRSLKKKARVTEPDEKAENKAGQGEPSSFFQPVKASLSSPASSAQSAQSFYSCVVHGDQQLVNNSMLVLRLTEPLNWQDTSFPAGTIVYGKVSLGQNRAQVSINRIAQTSLQLQVHHHSYHEGILLDNLQGVMQEAAQQTAFQQGQRSVQDLPLQMATDLGRNILQSSRRRGQALFLPDGFPLFLAKPNN